MALTLTSHLNKTSRTEHIPPTPASAQAPSPLPIALPSPVTTTVADAESSKGQEVLQLHALRTNPLWMQTNPHIQLQLKVDNVEIHLPDQTQVANLLLRDGLTVSQGYLHPNSS